MSATKDAGLLILRATAGGIMAAHGARKLFGVLNGPGFQGTAGLMQMLGLRPARAWAAAAGAGEFGGGVLTTLGFLNPVGPIGMVAAMAMATQKAHLGKGLFVFRGWSGVDAVEQRHRLGRRHRWPRGLRAGSPLRCASAPLVDDDLSGRRCGHRDLWNAPAPRRAANRRCRAGRCRSIGDRHRGRNRGVVTALCFAQRTRQAPGCLIAAGRLRHRALLAASGAIAPIPLALTSGSVCSTSGCKGYPIFLSLSLLILLSSLVLCVLCGSTLRPLFVTQRLDRP